MKTLSDFEETFTNNILIEYSKKTRIVHINFLKGWTTPTAEVLSISVIWKTGADDEGKIVTNEETKGAEIKLSEDLSGRRDSSSDKNFQETVYW